MQLKVRFVSSGYWCRTCVFFLALSWMVGLVLGMSFAFTIQDITVSLMRTVASGCVSIVGLFVMLIFPLALSAAAVRFSAPGIILLISFLKAFCYGFTSYAVLQAFGTSGWLIRVLLMFSDSCMVVLLFWFWIRHIQGSRRALRKDGIICTCGAVILGAVDYLLISPFLMTLIY